LGTETFVIARLNIHIYEYASIICMVDEIFDQFQKQWTLWY